MEEGSDPQENLGKKEIEIDSEIGEAEEINPDGKARYSEKAINHLNVELPKIIEKLKTVKEQYEIFEKLIHMIEDFPKKNQHFLNIGPGGSGKSFILSALFGYLITNDIGFKSASFSGTAGSSLNNQIRENLKLFDIDLTKSLPFTTTLFGLFRKYSTPQSWRNRSVTQSNYPNSPARIALEKEYANIKVLILDEIFSTSADFFELLNDILQNIRSNYELPFGGIMLICVGDPKQLPPVVSPEELKFFKTQADFLIENRSIPEEMKIGNFPFQSVTWGKMNWVIAELTRNIRARSDISFQRHLDQIYSGNFTQELFEEIKSCAGDPIDHTIFNVQGTERLVEGVSQKPTVTLTPTDEESKSINRSKMAEFEGKDHIFQDLDPETSSNFEMVKLELWAMRAQNSVLKNAKINQMAPSEEEDLHYKVKGLLFNFAKQSKYYVGEVVRAKQNVWSKNPPLLNGQIGQIVAIDKRNPPSLSILWTGETTPRTLTIHSHHEKAFHTIEVVFNEKSKGVTINDLGSSQTAKIGGKNRAKGYKTRYLNVCVGYLKVDYFPLEEGYAMTIHKSQGLTLPHVFISFKGINYSFFRPYVHSMIYVALSRAKELKNIAFLNTSCLDANVFKYCSIHPCVLEFLKSIKEKRDPKLFRIPLISPKAYELQKKDTIVRAPVFNAPSGGSVYADFGNATNPVPPPKKRKQKEEKFRKSVKFPPSTTDIKAMGVSTLPAIDVDGLKARYVKPKSSSSISNLI